MSIYNKVGIDAPAGLLTARREWGREPRREYWARKERDSPGEQMPPAVLLAAEATHANPCTPSVNAVAVHR